MPQRPGSLLTVMLAGQVIAGGSLSTTVTLKLRCAVRPAVSVALKVFTVVPIGKVPPLGNPAVCATVTPEQLSWPAGAA